MSPKIKPKKDTFAVLRERAAKQKEAAQAQDKAQQAAAQPAVKPRWTHRAIRIGKWVLPLAAVGAIGYHVLKHQPPATAETAPRVEQPKSEPTPDVPILPSGQRGYHVPLPENADFDVVESVSPDAHFTMMVPKGPWCKVCHDEMRFAKPIRDRMLAIAKEARAVYSDGLPFDRHHLVFYPEKIPSQKEYDPIGLSEPRFNQLRIQVEHLAHFPDQIDQVLRHEFVHHFNTNPAHENVEMWAHFTPLIHDPAVLKNSKAGKLEVLANRFTLGLLSRAWTSAGRFTPWPRHDTTDRSQYDAWLSYQKGMDTPDVERIRKTAREANHWYHENYPGLDAISETTGNDPFLPLDLYQARQRVKNYDFTLETVRKNPQLMRDARDVLDQSVQAAERVPRGLNFRSIRQWADVREMFHDAMRRLHPMLTTPEVEATYHAQLAEDYLDRFGELKFDRFAPGYKSIVTEKAAILRQTLAVLEKEAKAAKEKGHEDLLPGFQVRMQHCQEHAELLEAAAKRRDWWNLRPRK